MRMTRVFIDAPLAEGMRLELPAGPAGHVVRVLRLATGDELRLFNGRGGEFAATIDAVRRNEVMVRIGARRDLERESPLRITLLQGIARGEKMDLILQKATELGARAFVPVMMARSTVRLDSRTALARQQHWQAVVTSACEQSGRNTVPVVSAPVSLQDCLRASTGLRLLLAPGEDSVPLPALLGGVPQQPPERVELLVGPEGGFDPTETAAALAAGFTATRLGPRILRTETAGLAAIAALQVLAGDLR
ncbi:MAG: 16S rRNA (uracil(1498)-N(3))-methyltransferase [Steroidobacteraceae bacterium]